MVNENSSCFWEDFYVTFLKLLKAHNGFQTAFVFGLHSNEFSKNRPHFSVVIFAIFCAEWGSQTPISELRKY